jgi:hypothetical protein
MPLGTAPGGSLIDEGQETRVVVYVRDAEGQRGRRVECVENAGGMAGSRNM